MTGIKVDIVKAEVVLIIDNRIYLGLEPDEALHLAGLLVHAAEIIELKKGEPN